MLIQSIQAIHQEEKMTGTKFLARMKSGKLWPGDPTPEELRRQREEQERLDQELSNAIEEYGICNPLRLTGKTISSESIEKAKIQKPWHGDCGNI